MKKSPLRISFVAIYFLTTLCLFDQPGLAVTLVKDGKPVASIVVSDPILTAKPDSPRDGQKTADANPVQKVRLAAEELQRYIEKISGAKLPIISESEPVSGPVVLVGASKKTALLKLDIPSGLTSERKEEGYLIWAKNDTLVLAGNDEGPYQGTFFAVSEFLNRQGVRWFMPSEFGEVVPKCATIKIGNIEYRDKPDFIVRSWGGSGLAPELQRDDQIWELHNKLSVQPNQILQIPGDSWLRQYMPGKEMLTTHPEYFAKQFDGSIDPYMVNLTNPDVVKIVADKVKAKIVEERKKDPNFNSLGFAPDDGIPMDFTKETMALNQGFTAPGGRDGVPTELSISEEWFRFINNVIEEVLKDYPGFIITSNGYANRTFPPEGVKLNPNMGIMFAAIWCDLLHAYDDHKSWQSVMQGQELQRWGQICPHVFIYNYNYPLLVHNATPMPMTRKLARNMPLIKKWGIVGFEDEQAYQWMAHSIQTFYLRAKLYWHANDDAKAILNDYFEKWYGPAAKPSQAYWDAIEDTLEKTPILCHEDRVMPWVYTDELIASMEKSEQEAEKLAQEEPFKTRVRLDRLILEHLKGYMAMNRAEFIGDYAKAIREADYMLIQRDELHKISGYFAQPWVSYKVDARRNLCCTDRYWSVVDRKAFYETLLDMTSGKTGDLIVKAPREVKFTLDSADLGRIGRWYDSGFDRSSWRMIDTATPFYLQGDNMYSKQGVPYVGLMWYVFELDVPSSAIGKTIHVHAPIVATEAWVWTNGQYSGHRPYVEAYMRPGCTVDFDVTSQVKAGQNVIAFRVSTGLSHDEAAEGFDGPLFLYSPKSDQAAAAK